MHVDLPYLMRDRDRHGNARVFVRRNGRKVRIRVKEGTPEFAAAYSAALDSVHGRLPGTSAAYAAAPKGTFGWLAAQYFVARRFTRLDAKSQATRRLVIEECLKEPPRPGSKATMATCPISKITAAIVMMLMDRKVDLPGAANNRKKYLSAMFGWAVKNRHMVANPARDAERHAYATDGFHTWSVAEVLQYYERHPIGTKARVAMDLMLFLGARRGDVVTLGRQHARDGAMRYVPRKTRHKRLTVSEKPILPPLAATLAAGPCGDLTYLVTEYGRPFTANGFGSKFREWCNQAELPHCTAHGLRKAGATIAADNGATVHQLMALYDWTTPGQAEPYTRDADRRRLAAKAAVLITLPTAPPSDQLSHRSK